MSQTVSQKHAYLIRRNGIFYFSRRVPSDLQTRFNKGRVTISLRTRSQAKAEKSAEALSDRLERYWDGLRLEIFHTTELGLTKVVSSRLRDTIQSVSVKEALDNYLRLKAGCRSITFLQGANRSVDYLLEATGITELEALNAQHAAGLRDFLFARGMTASSVRRVFGNIRAIVNLAIKEHGLEYPSVFANAFIPDDGRTKKRLPIPTDCIFKSQEFPSFLSKIKHDTPNGIETLDEMTISNSKIHLKKRFIKPGVYKFSFSFLTLRNLNKFLKQKMGKKRIKLK